MQFIVPIRSPRGRQQTLKRKLINQLYLFWDKRVCKRVCARLIPKQKKRCRVRHLFALVFGWKMGFEPTTFGTTIRHSNRLSYIHHIIRFRIGDKSNTLFSYIQIFLDSFFEKSYKKHFIRLKKVQPSKKITIFALWNQLESYTRLVVAHQVATLWDPSAQQRFLPNAPRA